MIARSQLRVEWEARIADYRSSGLTMAAWCAANQCTKDQLKYWLYKSKSSLSSGTTTPDSPPRFVPLAVTEAVQTAPTSPLVLRIGAASIELHNGFDSQLLREVVQVLKASC